jgi:adenylate cyclase
LEQAVAAGCAAARGEINRAPAHRHTVTDLILPVRRAELTEYQAACAEVEQLARGFSDPQAASRDLFARFVPPDVVAQVVARTDDNLRLGAVESDCTVLFSDLRGFTSFSETQPVSRVIDVVNCYLNEMTEAIQEAGGTLISYMGDGIMALFGAPLEQPDHADRAVRAAIEMIGPRLDAFNAWLAEQGLEHSFRMGVGLNSGPVMAGSIGSERRVEYTALGDTTNTASRLEGMTKGSGHMLFVAQSTRDRMSNPPEDLEPFGELEVRGRTEKLPVWTIPDPS